MNQLAQYQNQLAQYQNQIAQYPNPLAYFANTPRSIEKRKRKASIVSPMKIINFIRNDDGSFVVSIKGIRGIYYQVFFSEREITCSCPDYQKHSVKPICKHMFKCICLSDNHDIFNNSMLLSDLMNPQYLGRILENIMRIIDIKKMERFGNQQNQISIERDEYSCAICYGEFDNDIAKCSKCKHVFHQNCINLSWNSGAYNARGKCPMCRTLNSFPQLGGSNNEDPWEIYNFSSPAAVVEEEQLPVQNDILQLSEVEQNEGSNVPIEIVAQNDILQLSEVEQNEGSNVPIEIVAQNDILQLSEVEQNEGSNVPIEIVAQNDINNNAFFQNEPFFPIEENFGDNSNTPPSSPPPPSSPLLLPLPLPLPLSSTEEIDVDLLELEETEIINRRITILNISVFILETVNIIINHIFYQLEHNN